MTTEMEHNSNNTFVVNSIATIFILFQPYNKSSNTSGADDSTPLDKWSAVWYVASFGGLIAFFLIVSCSEWCCRRNVRNGCSRDSTQIGPANTPETPPPSYDHFAPPPYESVDKENSEKSEFEVYVVPAHALGSILKSSSENYSPSNERP